MVALVKLLLINWIKRRIKKAMVKKLLKNKTVGVGSVLALVVGVVSQLLGVDIAPSYVDAVVTVTTGTVAIYNAWRQKQDAELTTQ